MNELNIYEPTKAKANCSRATLEFYQVHADQGVPVQSYYLPSLLEQLSTLASDIHVYFSHCCFFISALNNFRWTSGDANGLIGLLKI